MTCDVCTIANADRELEIESIYARNREKCREPALLKNKDVSTQKTRTGAAFRITAINTLR
jgi:hypothetical protein